MSNQHKDSITWALSNITSADADRRVRAGARLRLAHKSRIISEMRTNLESADEFVRVEVVRVLAHHEAALDDRLHLAKADTSEYVRKACISSLRLAGNTPVICRALRHALQDPAEQVRIAAMIALTLNHCSGAADALRARLQASSWDERWWCCCCLHRLGHVSPDLVEAARKLLVSEECAAHDAEVMERRKVLRQCGVDTPEIVPTTHELMMWAEAALKQLHQP